MTRVLFTVFALSTVISAPAWAEDLAMPEGKVILTVSGNVANTNADGTAQFDLEMLEALESDSFETSTIWTEGTIAFEGVPLSVLVEVLGIEGETLRATAINDYAIEVPLSDAIEDGPIVAYRMNGETMSVRDKGPLWLVYPYDLNADYRTEVIYSRSIWQLDRMEAID